MGERNDVDVTSVRVVPDYRKKEIGGSPDFQLEPNHRISQANHHVAGSNHLTG
jgi:hypothetical protein